MEHITHCTFEGNKKIEKCPTGPRAETLALIRQFARTYKFEPDLQPKLSGFLVN